MLVFGFLGFALGFQHIAEGSSATDSQARGCNKCNGGQSEGFSDIGEKEEAIDRLCFRN
jgi:hypothetical protein